MQNRAETPFIVPGDFCGWLNAPNNIPIFRARHVNSSADMHSCLRYNEDDL